MSKKSCAVLGCRARKDCVSFPIDFQLRKEWSRLVNRAGKMTRVSRILGPDNVLCRSHFDASQFNQNGKLKRNALPFVSKKYMRVIGLSKTSSKKKTKCKKRISQIDRIYVSKPTQRADFVKNVVPDFKGVSSISRPESQTHLGNGEIEWDGFLSAPTRLLNFVEVQDSSDLLPDFDHSYSLAHVSQHGEIGEEDVYSRSENSSDNDQPVEEVNSFCSGEILSEKDNNRIACEVSDGQDKEEDESCVEKCDFETVDIMLDRNNPNPPKVRPLLLPVPWVKSSLGFTALCYAPPDFEFPVRIVNMTKSKLREKAEQEEAERSGVEEVEETPVFEGEKNPKEGKMLCFHCKGAKNLLVGRDARLCNLRNRATRFCLMPGCKARRFMHVPRGLRPINFFPLPKDVDQCALWTKMTETIPKEIKKWGFCERHFITGRPHPNPAHYDYVPHRELPPEKRRQQILARIKRHFERDCNLDYAAPSTANEVNYKAGSISVVFADHPPFTGRDQSGKVDTLYFNVSNPLGGAEMVVSGSLCTGDDDVVDGDEIDTTQYVVVDNKVEHLYDKELQSVCIGRNRLSGKLEMAYCALTKSSYNLSEYKALQRQLQTFRLPNKVHEITF